MKTVSELPFKKYLKVEIGNKIKTDKKLANISVFEFFRIFITKFLGTPNLMEYISSRMLHYVYGENENQIDICVLIDFNSQTPPEKFLSPEKRLMCNCDCATIFISTDRMSVLGATYMKLIMARRIFNNSALLFKTETLFKGNLKVPIQKDFGVLAKEIDLSKFPKKVLDKKIIEMYLSATFFTRDIYNFSLIDKQIFVCVFEDEFICAAKPKPDCERYIVWVPFIPNNKTIEESSKTIGKIEKRINIQRKYTKKGIIFPILRVSKIGKLEKSFPKRQIPKIRQKRREKMYVGVKNTKIFAE